MEIAGSIVINAFEAMGGDPSNAVTSAGNYSSVSSWVKSQAGQACAAGAVAMAIPGAHLPAMVADIAFLLHKMAYCCWGIGEIKNCIVLGKSDFQNILALWSGAQSIDELDHRAVSKATFEAGMVAGGTTIAGIATATVLSQLSAQQIATFAGGQVGQKIAGKLGAKGMGKAGGKVAGKLVAKTLGKKLATKLGVKFGSKIGVKAFAGMIPLLGPAVGGGVNYYFVNDIAKSAEKYYSASI